MGKVITLLLLILLAFRSRGYYLVLATKINADRRQLAEG